MSAIAAIKGELDALKHKRAVAGKFFDQVAEEHAKVSRDLEQHRNRVSHLNDRIEALHKALRILEDV